MAPFRSSQMCTCGGKGTSPTRDAALLGLRQARHRRPRPAATPRTQRTQWRTPAAHRLQSLLAPRSTPAPPSPHLVVYAARVHLVTRL